MIPADAIKLVIEPGLSLLPRIMDSDQARIMLLAIGLQESRFTHRRQIRGPARSFYQFELNGVRGVLAHASTRSTIRDVLTRLQYDHEQATSYAAIEHNDALATVYARLLLWTLPYPLPVSSEHAWDQYIDAWRPGKPHRHTWDQFYDLATRTVRGAP